jgi:TrmH family RNA methyltransferase
MIITSPQNPRVKAAVRLRERRQREREGLALVEGFAEVSHCLAAGHVPVLLFVDGNAAGSREARQLLDRLRAGGTEVFETSPEVFAKLAYREHPDGWLAVVPIPRLSLERLEAGEDALILVVHGVEKPGNLGAMLRTADAVGASVILCEARTDAFNPNVVRASKGAVFSVALAEAGAAEAIGWLRQRGIRIVAASPDGERNYARGGLRRAVAIVVGAEDRGLPAEWTEAADQRVAIPMVGRVNSLNVSVAAALLLYEAASLVPPARIEDSPSSGGSVGG